MWLKYIKLKNMRCFSDLELSFTHEDGPIRKWTILLGENGTGKSNILQAIALITAGSNALSDLLGDPNEWIKYGKSYCEIKAVVATKRNQEHTLKLRFERGDDRSSVLIRNRDSLAPLDKAIAHAKRNYFVVGYGASRRLNVGRGRRVKSSDFYERRAQNVATLFDKDALLTPLETWAMDLDYIEGASGVGKIRRILDTFLPGVRFSHIDKKQGKLFCKTVDGIIPLNLLSEGYQNLTGWVGDMLYRITETFGDYRYPLRARSLVLIDEVALHIHIGWQRELLSFIDKRLPNCQMIVTTHSPITAQQANAGELHYLERKRSKVNIHEFSANPKTLLLHQLITADLFGLVSDESREVEVNKQKYRRLRDKDLISASEKRELIRLKGDLEKLPIQQRGTVTIQEKHLDLLQRIEQQLSSEDRK